MPATSVVTPQNQYFPANAERMAVHCLESGCIGKYIPQEISRGQGFSILRPERFPQVPNTSLLSAVYGDITTQGTVGIGQGPG